MEERDKKMEHVLLHHLTREKVNSLTAKTNKATHIIVMQSYLLKELLDKGLLEDFRHVELEKMLIEFFNQQGISERIKKFPYPMQYAKLNLYFIRIFVFLV